jgi:hypothetical protein
MGELELDCGAMCLHSCGNFAVAALADALLVLSVRCRHCAVAAPLQVARTLVYVEAALLALRCLVVA